MYVGINTILYIGN